MKKNLGIIFFDSIDFELGNYLITNLKKKFKIKFNNYELLTETLDFPSEAYNEEINQYFVSIVLDKLRSYAIDNEFYKVLGIFPHLLYTKWFHYVFGQAEYGDEEETRASVVSNVRLKVNANNIDDGPIYFKRVLKECIHEIGHTLNLDHCDNDCVMKKSSLVPDIDKKSINFCLKCKKLIHID